MARKSVEINPKIKERFKFFLKENNLTQRMFAEEFGYTEQYVSCIARGIRNLTDELARNMSAKYPGTRFEWLLGLDDFKTEREKFTSAIQEVRDAYYHISNLIALHGYKFSELDFSHADNFTKECYTESAIEIKKNDAEKVIIPHKQWRRLVAEINRFVDFQLEGLFPQKK